MLRISKLADYAIVILDAMLAGTEERYTATSISEITGLPDPTAAKVLKLLSRAGVLSSTRGATGGYSLKENAGDVGLSEIIQAVDGPIALTACVESSEKCCEHALNCSVKGRWDLVNDAIKNALDSVKLSDMTTGGKG